jgi:hypothetical protein
MSFLNLLTSNVSTKNLNYIYWRVYFRKPTVIGRRSYELVTMIDIARPSVSRSCSQATTTETPTNEETRATKIGQEKSPHNLRTVTNADHLQKTSSFVAEYLQ